MFIIVYTSKWENMTKYVNFVLYLQMKCMLDRYKQINRWMDVLDILYSNLC